MDALDMCLAIPGEVIEIRERHGLRFADVSFGGLMREVCLHCEPDVVCGDFVLVHVGFAIAKLNREEAERAWSLLEELGQSDAIEAELSGVDEEPREERRRAG